MEIAAEIIDSELKSEGESTKLLLLIFDADKFTQCVQEKIPKAGSRVNQQMAVFRNSNAMKNMLQVKPTDYHLSIVREILTKQLNGSNVKIDSPTINKCWVDHVIQFILLMLKDVFMLEIENETDNTMNGKELPSSTTNDSNENANVNKISKKFDITGTRDVFLGRKQTKKITINSLSAEMIDSQERFKNTAWEIQLKASVYISTDSLDAVMIEFNDLIKTRKNNSFKTFFTNFDQNLNNLLKIYFVNKKGNLSGA